MWNEMLDKERENVFRHYDVGQNNLYASKPQTANFEMN
jgi:hypothetical protein